MDGLKLLKEARAAGLRVTPRGDKLVVRGPKQAEPVALRLLKHKAEVMAAMSIRIGPDDLPGDWRCEWEERSAVMEYDGGLPRERAEARALDDIVQRMRQAGIDTLHYN